jgi:hypothetical protein
MLILNVVFHPIVSIVLCILLFSQMVSKNSILHPAIGVLLFVTIILGTGFRPRKPYVIHSYINRMFLKVFLVVSLGMAAVVGWATFSILKLDINLNAGFIVMLLIVALMCLALVYVLYWSLPFSRKTTGIAAVDAAIAKYKKPKEEVAGAWEPPAVVDGKAYHLISYQGQKETPLAFDRQGNIVRDIELMQKISCCSQLAIQTARPDAINQRTSSYMRTQKGMKQLELGLQKYDQWVKPLEKLCASADIVNVKQHLILFKRYAPAVCEGWELEAEWGRQRGNAHLKEVHYEEMLALSKRINQNLNFLLKEADTLSKGIASALEIQNVMKKNRQLDRESPNLKYLLDLVLVSREMNEIVKSALAGQRELPSKYGNAFNEERVSSWRERLKWADQVDKRKA